MEKVKVFFDMFAKSLLPQHPSYSHFAKSSFKKSFGYFLVLIFFLNALYASYVIFTYSPKTVRSMFQELKRMLVNYPADLFIKIDQGSMITNYDRPYMVWSEYGGKKRLVIVVDESATIQKMDDYPTLILLTQTDLIIKGMGKNQSNIIIPLNHIEKRTITKEVVSQYEKIAENVLAFLPLLYLVFIFIIYVVVPTLSLFKMSVFLGVAAIILFLFFKLYNKRRLEHIRFFEIFKIGFYAITLPLSLLYIFRLFGVEIRPIYFFFLTIISLFTGIYEAYLDVTPSSYHRR